MTPPPKAGAPSPVDPEARVSLDTLPLEPEVRSVLEEQGIQALYPPQAEALGPVLNGESVLLACPTASGKSLVAYLGLVRAARHHRTGLYLVPLRALAQEKHEELQAFERLGLRVGISIGDFDLPSATLEKLDILVATSEKADALLRRGSPWLDRLGCVVADEVHLLRDPDRGPTLEVSLTRLRRAHPELQLIALSATVGNSVELAEWMRARHIASEFRPVPLRSGVYHDGTITFTDLTNRRVPGPGDALPRLVRTVIEDGGQALVFVNTRKASEQVAEALAPTVRGLLDRRGRDEAVRAREELGQVSEEETEGIRRLGHLLPDGIAFHNASLTNPERRVVERAFRDRILKALVATPTLAAGINLPARRVIVRDTHRYDDRVGGQAPIPALEIQQMCGRAGRPRFDREGEAVLLARSVEEAERFLDEYLSAPPEQVRSHLAAEPALRMHLLALVASGEVSTEAELEAFFGETFYGHTLPVSELAFTVGKVRAFLEENGLLEPEKALRATPFGALTSELYLDPLSAVLIRRALERAPFGVGVFPLLHAIAATPDLPPLFLRRGEERAFLGRYTEEEPELLAKAEEEPYSVPLDLFLATLKTAEVLEAWIAETPIVEISERYGIGAGDLRAKVEDAEWLLFGTSRLANRYQRRLARPVEELSLRVRYGIREELLDLVHLRGVGRARARALFQAGFHDRDSLRSAPVDRVAQALRSPRLAEMILREVHHPRAKAGVPPSGPPPAATPMPAPPALGPPRSARRGRRLDDFATEPGEPATPPPE